MVRPGCCKLSGFAFALLGIFPAFFVANGGCRVPTRQGSRLRRDQANKRGGMQPRYVAASLGGECCSPADSVGAGKRAAGPREVTKALDYGRWLTAHGDRAPMEGAPMG